tara:strand:- start:2468 stop:3316 length:849 start_codon:yes stop_codon:yes gene_type:complete
MEQNLNSISKEIKEKGVVSVNNILSNRELEYILNIVKEPKKGTPDSYYPTNFRQYLIKLLKLDFKKINNSLFLKKIAKKLNFKKIAETAFGAKAKLQMIDCYYNKQSNNQILSWHNDIGIQDINPSSLTNFYNTANATFSKNSGTARGIKFFINLTDVNSDNGSLAVIPYSAEIVKSVCTLILNKKINPASFWKLKNLRDLVKQKSVQSLLNEKVQNEKIQQFLLDTKFIDNETPDTSKFDFNLKKGSAVIFDELSVHRGSAPQKTDRIVLRFIYKKINLPN